MNLHYENNELYAEGVRLADAADTLGSPLFVMSRAAVGEAWRALGSPFREAGVPAVLYFSAKTNPVPAFLLELKALGAGLEVVSEYELWLARRLGYSKILVNGTGKPPGLLGRALEAGVDLYVIESRAELEEVLAAGRHRPPVRPLPVALRICPGLPGGNPATSSGAKGSPFGFDMNELAPALRLIKDRSDLEFRGFQAHIGTGLQSIGPFKKSLAALKRAVGEASTLGLKTECLDLGGGLGTSAAPMLNALGLFRTHVLHRSVTPKAGRDDLAERLAGELKLLTEELSSAGAGTPKIILEPGRALAAPCFLLLATVGRLVHKAGRCYAFCDIGGMSLTPLLLVEHHRLVPLIRRPGSPLLRYDVMGDMPSHLDRLAIGAALGELRPGDRLALLDTGAYFISYGNNFRGPRPGIVLIDGDRLSSVRRAETFEDVTSRDGGWA
jgi:diaminopimelate decarboxylase